MSATAPPSVNGTVRVWAPPYWPPCPCGAPPYVLSQGAQCKNGHVAHFRNEDGDVPALRWPGNITAAPAADPRWPAIPGSRSLGVGNVGKSGTSAETVLGTVRRVWEMSEPEPRQWAIVDLVPGESNTILYADGGMGKSYLGLYFLTLSLLGKPFAGRVVRPITSGLYVDAELDESEFVRRAYQVARGLGLERPPDGLHYWRLPGPLSDDAVMDAARLVMASVAAELFILDSLTVASFGTDAREQADMTAILKQIETWKSTGILIDHPPAPKPGVNTSTYRPFGTTFKYNLARSVLQLVRADGGGLVLRQTKSNFGQFAEPINLAVEYGPGQVRYEMIDAADERMAGADDHLPAIERVYRALREGGGEGATPEGLGEALDMAPKTVRNHLTALKSRQRVENREGRWHSRFPDPLGTGNGNVVDSCATCGERPIYRQRPADGRAFCREHWAEAA
jgi:hypothetical protein